MQLCTASAFRSPVATSSLTFSPTFAALVDIRARVAPCRRPKARATIGLTRDYFDSRGLHECTRRAWAVFIKRRDAMETFSEISLLSDLSEFELAELMQFESWTPCARERSCFKRPRMVDEILAQPIGGAAANPPGEAAFEEQAPRRDPNVVPQGEIPRRSCLALAAKAVPAALSKWTSSARHRPCLTCMLVLATCVARHA